MISQADRTVEQSDVCVIGTGAGGGILAYQLATAGVSVLSLEQGPPIDNQYFTNHLPPEQEHHFGVTSDVPWPMSPGNAYIYANARARQLYATSESTSTSPASETTFVNRQILRLNGKTNLWNAVSLRQSARDFRGRDHGDSDVNWPIGYDDLESHYLDVEQLIGVCGTREGLAELPDGHFHSPKPFRPADSVVVESLARLKHPHLRAIPNRKAIETRPDRENRCRNCGDCVYGCSYGSTYKFSNRLLPEIIDRDNYQIRCNTKVAALIRDPESSWIRAARCIDTETGREFEVQAKSFVICAGAIETPRLLLNSTDQAFPNGLANSSGAVGCYLQDSLKLTVASPLLRLVGKRARYDQGFSDNLIIPRFLFDNDDGFRGGFMAQVCHFLPTRPYYVEGLAPFPGWLRKRLAKLFFRTYVALMFFGKGEVRRSNRVRRGSSVDQWGVSQVDVDYEFADGDRRMLESMERWGTRLLSKCSGWLPVVLREDLPGHGIHYAGTCRMAASADDGVVNSDLQCFDHPNLYIADGSVFPDMSEKNLSLTIMALASRLAGLLAKNHDHQPARRRKKIRQTATT